MAHLKLSFTLNPLDPKFVAAKPLQVADLTRIKELEVSERLIKTRKRDGYCGLAVITGRRRNVRLYTRSIVDTSSRFPAIIDALRDSAIPTDTLIPGEMFFRTSDDTDRLDLFSRLSKSTPARATALQGEMGHANFMPFVPLVVRGRDVSTFSFGQRFAIVGEWLDKSVRLSQLIPMQALVEPVSVLQQRVVREGWEGLVLYDTHASTTYRLDGKTEDPPRPDGAWKWKPIFEDDFIVRKFEQGTGKNADGAGKLYLSQIDPKTGDEVACGEVADLGSLVKRRELARMRYPLVVQVQFESRTAGGALRISKLLRVRDDKELRACVLPESHHGISQKR